ncbi:MAG TPA: ATP-dependent DNA helicase [Actinomycetes bacterium]|nr:ATP-dependent DNA helicase [Actinomycetes bacterium]
MTQTPVHLDDHQQRVADRVAVAGHGPVLVLAGPGTGKTTTIIEAIAARVDAGTSPDRILTLTFSRRAAAELRARIGQRLGRTVSAPLAWTFHGFGFSLIGEQLAPDDLGRALRLLSGSEQEVVVRELLAHDREVGRVAWPETLSAALRTRGFTEQVRTFMSTARSLGLAPGDVAALSEQRDDWAAISSFMREYFDVMDSRGLLDYSELVSRAVAYAESSTGRQQLRHRFELVVVDEYQDTDPAQERLLHAIAGDGRDVLAVGDPDQSIYAFRGADVRGITEFTERFRARDGSRAEIMTLATSRRCAASVVRSSRRVAELLGPAGSLPTPALRRHRELVVPDEAPEGSVEVRCFPTAEREAAAIAELLRHEHLHGGTPWSQMAVLVRSGVTAIPGLQRALSVAGVPVDVALDEVPLREHPAVAPFVALLEYAIDADALTPDRVHELLLSPLVGASASDVRRLGRALRERERGDGVTDPAPSAELIRAAVLDPVRLADLAVATARPAARLAELLDRMQSAVASRLSAHDALWSIWNGSAWSRALIARAESGVGTEAVEANRSLDALVALFDLAARSRERSPRPDFASFLAEVAAQEIPAGPSADVGVRGEGVRVLTAHRSKGLEWDVVVVASVQAEDWPDVRRRGSILDTDRLGAEGLRTPQTVADLRREERRLFYVALTRARRRVVCTAVEALADDGRRPSPFLDDLGVDIARENTPIRHPTTLPGIVSQLRCVLNDPDQSDSLRRAAAQRLALLAREGDHASVPPADPARWWGVRQHSGQRVPSPPDDPERPLLHLSGSQLETLQRCPLQWYLSRRVRAERGRGAPAGFGGVLHALAEAVATGELPGEVDALVAALDDVWGQLPFPAAWEATQEHDLAVQAIERFLHWHSDARDRILVEVEQEYAAVFAVGEHRIQLSGRVDRLERALAGAAGGAKALVVVDFKTSRTPRTAREAETDLQLATYRRLVAHQHDVSPREVSAELVQLRHAEGKDRPGPKVQQQQASEVADEALDTALDRAVMTITSGSFPATPGKACSYCEFALTCPAQPVGREVLS